MPPEPFKPPRPRASTSTTNSNAASKPRGRPKGTTSKEKPDSGKKAMRSKSAKEMKRTSGSSSRFAALPSLSPETRRELEGSDEDGDSNEGEDSDLEMLDRIPSSQQEEEEDDPFSSQPQQKRKSNTTNTKSRPSTSRSTKLEDEDMAVAEEEEDEIDRKEKIPEQLLSVLLHQFFKEEGTRMHKDANKATARYMEVFVREGIARAVWGRDHDGNGMGGGLEVEDLEKLAPQLILDF